MLESSIPCPFREWVEPSISSARLLTSATRYKQHGTPINQWSQATQPSARPPTLLQCQTTDDEQLASGVRESATASLVARMRPCRHCQCVGNGSRRVDYRPQETTFDTSGESSRVSKYHQLLPQTTLTKRNYIPKGRCCALSYTHASDDIGRDRELDQRE